MSDIRKAVDASPELRSKKDLIESFIAGVNDVEDVMTTGTVLTVIFFDQKMTVRTVPVVISSKS